MISHIDHLVLRSATLSRRWRFTAAPSRWSPSPSGRAPGAALGNQKINLQLLGRRRNRAQVGSGISASSPAGPGSGDGPAGEPGVEIVEASDEKRCLWSHLKCERDSSDVGGGNFAGASAPLVLNVLFDHLQRCSAARARKVERDQNTGLL